MLTIQSSVDLKINRKVKAVFYGCAGSGKTVAALTFPRPLVADAEGGTLLYCGREDIKPFHRVAVTTSADLVELIDVVQRDNGKTWDTLVIDPITVVYDVLKTTESENYLKDMNPRKWGKVNGVIGMIFNRLLNLNVHVVVIARESPLYDTAGGDMKVIGAKPDCPKDVAFLADYIVRFHENHTGSVEKSRGQDIGKGDRLKEVTYATFAPTQRDAAPAPEVESIEQAALRAEFQDREAVNVWLGKWKDKAIGANDVVKALGVQKFSEWVKGFTAADVAINAYIDQQANDKPAAPIGATA